MIFNVPSMEYPEVMFYTGFLAYEIVPDQEIMELLSARDYSVVVLWPEGRDEEFLPEGMEIWPVTWPSSEFKKEP